MTDEQKYCETCNHIEMCKWTPISGCEFHSKHEQRPHGEWICNEDGNYACSECGIAWKDMPAKDAKPVFKACPWCGADMRSEEGEEK